jgi:hypothetical protein
MTEDDRRLPRPTVRLATPALQLSVPCVSKRFAATQALQDVSLDLVAGEIRGLVGENGAEKSRSCGDGPGERVWTSGSQMPDRGFEMAGRCPG